MGRCGCRGLSKKQQIGPKGSVSNGEAGGKKQSGGVSLAVASGSISGAQKRKGPQGRFHPSRPISGAQCVLWHNLVSKLQSSGAGGKQA